MVLPQFIEWAFMGLVSSAGGAVCFLLWRLLLSIRDLNAQIAQIVERTTWHGKSIDNLNERVYDIEKRI